MKRLISLLLALILLATPAAALDLSDITDELQNNEQLREGIAYILENMQNITNEVKNNEQLQQGIQSAIDNMSAFTEAVKSMTDEELEQQILAIAEEYHIPDMNEEQIDFIIRLCRSLEKAEEFSETVDNYQEKASDFGQSIKTLFDNLGKILDTLTGILDSLNGLLDKLGGASEPTEPTPVPVT